MLLYTRLEGGAGEESTISSSTSRPRLRAPPGTRRPRLAEDMFERSGELYGQPQSQRRLQISFTSYVYL